MVVAQTLTYRCKKMSKVTEKFEAVYNTVVQLRSLCAEIVEPDSYIMNTFDNVQDELTSLGIYIEEMESGSAVDSIPRILQETPFRNS